MNWLSRLLGSEPDDLPIDPLPVLDANVRWWPHLTADDRARVLDHLRHLVHRTRWEAANGFVLTDEMKIVIAALVSIMQLGRTTETQRPSQELGTVIVHASAQRTAGTRSAGVSGVLTDSAVAIDGMTTFRGPMLLAWDAIEFEARNPEHGRNVVIHEFAHRLDMADGVVDGTPIFDHPAQHDDWVRTLTPVFESIRDGKAAVIRPYGGLNPGEFFAVVSELFFARPRLLERAEPEVFARFSWFYNLDPRPWDTSEA